MLQVADLSNYQIDLARGFVPAEEPPGRLPAYYAPWENIAGQLSDWLMSGRLRMIIDHLPHLSLEQLESEGEWQRAMLLLSVMGHAYVWGGAEPAAQLPAQIAVPWWQLAEKIGRPPVGAHQSMVLNNWRRLAPERPLALDNVTTQVTFVGGIDESWFYLVTLQIELDGALAVPALLHAQAAVAQDRPELLAEQLQFISDALTAMLHSLGRMVEKCDPYIFFNRIRPYFDGWAAPGLVYEGVSNAPQQFVGGSAAQSALLQALDAGLGVVHTSERTRPFLQEMRHYMPCTHRNFLAALESGPAVREYIYGRAENHPQLVDLYNRCISQLDAFRQKHIEISVRYIIHQTPKDQEVKGTGGTSFVPFLSEARKETKRQLMQDESRSK